MQFVELHEVGMYRRQPVLAYTYCSARERGHHRGLNSQLMPADDVIGGQ